MHNTYLGLNRTEILVPASWPLVSEFGYAIDNKSLGGRFLPASELFGLFSLFGDALSGRRSDAR